MEKNVSETILKTLEESLPEMLEKTLEAKLKDVNEEILKLKEKGVSNVELEEKGVAEAVFKGLSAAIKGGDVETVKKAMGENSIGAGAELVFDRFSKDVANVVDNNKLVNYFTKEGAENARKYIKPKFDGDSITSYKITELGVSTPSDAATSNLPITINKRVILTNLSEEILKDNMTIPTLYQLLVQTIGVEYAGAIENESINGDGTNGDIEGLFVDANVNTIVMEAGKTSFKDVSDNDIVQLVTSTEDKYGNDDDNILVMHKSVKGILMNLKTTTGAPVYPELRTDGTIMGYKVVTSTKMPKSTDSAADTPFILFGNFKHIILAENGGEEIELAYSGEGFANAIKTLRAIKRDGLGILYPKAFSKLQTAIS